MLTEGTRLEDGLPACTAMVKMEELWERNWRKSYKRDTNEVPAYCSFSPRCTLTSNTLQLKSGPVPELMHIAQRNHGPP